MKKIKLPGDVACDRNYLTRHKNYDGHNRYKLILKTLLRKKFGEIGEIR